jgi:hypothetical protein
MKFESKKGRDKYYNAHHHGRSVDPVVRRGRRLLLEETKVAVTAQIKDNLARKRGETDMNIFYIIGVIVVVLFVAGFLGLR